MTMTPKLKSLTQNRKVKKGSSVLAARLAKVGRLLLSRNASALQSALTAEASLCCCLFAMVLHPRVATGASFITNLRYSPYNEAVPYLFSLVPCLKRAGVGAW